MKSLLFVGVLFALAGLCLTMAGMIQAGEIVRNPSVIREFKRTVPCPATGRAQRSCPGYVVDHKIPLCAGGADAVGNLQWQDKRAGLQKDKLEWLFCRKLKECRK